MVFQTSPAGANTWTTVCTDNVTPYGCSWDTTGVADGLRDIRAVATDTAGYSRTSTVTNRRVDNTGATATTTDPGSPLTGTVSVTGVGSDLGSGVASTTVQYRPSGGGSWTDICTQAGGHRHLLVEHRLARGRPLRGAHGRRRRRRQPRHARRP